MKVADDKLRSVLGITEVKSVVKRAQPGGGGFHAGRSVAHGLA